MNPLPKSQITRKGSIALVTLDYPPERGGVARFLGNLVTESKGEIDVFVNTTHATTGPGFVQAVDLLASSGVFRWWKMVGFFRSLSRLGYRHILVSHLVPVGTAAWLASWVTGLKYTVVVHGLDLQLVRQSKRKSFIARRILREANHVIVNSVYVRSLVQDFCPSAKTVLVTPGVEVMQFPSRDEARKRLNISADVFLVLLVARLIPRKGIDVLIEAMRDLPQAKLVVIGDGSDHARLKGIAEHVGISVLFLNQVDDAERNEWYAAADCFALPVRQEGVDIEGFGIVYLEAALAGLPVIAGKSGGASEAVVDQETGFVVEPTSDEVRHALEILIADHELAQRLGQNGRVRALKEFRWEDRWKIVSELLR